MATRQQRLLAACAALLLVGLAVFLVWPTTSRVHLSRFGKTDIGMTEPAVTALLGEPDRSPCLIEVPAGGFERAWLGKGEFIAVAFDKDGLVSDKVFGELFNTGDADSFMDRVRRWLRL